MRKGLVYEYVQGLRWPLVALAPTPLTLMPTPPYHEKLIDVRARKAT